MFVSDFKTKNMFNIYLRPFQPFPRLWFSDPIQSTVGLRLLQLWDSFQTSANIFILGNNFKCQALSRMSSTYKNLQTGKDGPRPRETRLHCNRSPLPNTGHRTAASSGLDFLLHIHRRSRPLLTLTAWKMKPGISGDMMTSHMSSTGRRTGSGSLDVI